MWSGAALYTPEDPPPRNWEEAKKWHEGNLKTNGHLLTECLKDLSNLLVISGIYEWDRLSQTDLQFFSLALTFSNFLERLPFTDTISLNRSLHSSPVLCSIKNIFFQGCLGA